MIGPHEALELILGNTPVLGGEDVELQAAVGRVLAREVFARADLPSFDNSAMDGFAVRSRDCSLASRQAPALLTLKETVRAGVVPRRGLRPGEAIKIMTGAPLPRGSDAVVMREAARDRADGRVAILSRPALGENVRRHGEDVRAGARILTAGVKLRPYEVALLAAQGIERVFVVKRPRVAIVATGDELTGAGGRLAPGKIRDANGPALAAALSRWGAVALDRGIVRDDRPSMPAALARAWAGADVLLVTGGVSVGDFDHTQDVLEELGLRVVFWKAAIKPGKPLLFGVRGSKAAFGLPGNPVAALVCLEEFVRPALEKLQGHAPAHPSYHLSGRAANDYPKPKDRQQYLFCRAERRADGYALRIIRPQGSAMLGMACRADALAIAPAGPGRVKKGDELAFRWLK